MEEKQLEFRAYFFVPYNISSMQRGIQAKHAFDEFLLAYGRRNPDHIVWDYMKNHKTVIILNGGTTNSRREIGTGIVQGTLDQIGDSLLENNIEFSYFKEPDLNNALTAVCFLADERIWNYEDYPDFLNWVLKNIWYDEPSQRIVELRMMSTEELISMIPEHYEEWVEFLGGGKNVFLRELIRGKKLA